MYHEEAAACTRSHVVITINDTVENWVLFCALLFSTLFATSSNKFHWNTYVNAFLNMVLAFQMRSDRPGLLQLCITFTKNILYILYIGVSMDTYVLESDWSWAKWIGTSLNPWSENIHYYTFICFRSCQSTIKQYDLRGSAVILSFIKFVMPA